jgi:GT2 family glycosyltransferase
MTQAAVAPSPLPLSIVVVNYNGGERLADCLESLARDPDRPRDILVVDNASTDGSPAVLRNVAELHPDMVPIWSARNLGYAGAVNLALPRARGEFVAVLNMDITVKSGWARALVEFLRTHPGAGAANPLIALQDGRRVNATGQDVHVTGLGFNRGLGRPVERVGRAPFAVSGIQGGAFVIRRVLLERIGGMDSTGFLYHEDVNLSWLLQLMGFDLYCVPEGQVVHDYFLTMYPGKLYLLERNRWAMLLAYLHWPTLILLSPFLLLTEVLVWSYCLLRGWAFVREKAASYRWVVRRWPQVKKRRALAESVRTRTDWRLLKGLRWGYPLGQFLTLGREREDSRRQPVGGLPREAIRD